MDIISQLKHEVSERAGSPAGFLRLIQLLMREVERIDVRSPQAPAQYVALLRAYVIVKRQLGRFSHQCEMEALGQPDPWDTVAYNDTFRRLKYAMKMKRNEAREYAALSIPQEQIKEINKVVGRSFSYNLHRFDVNSAPLWSSSEYMGAGAIP